MDNHVCIGFLKQIKAKLYKLNCIKLKRIEQQGKSQIIKNQLMKKEGIFDNS